MVPIYLQIANTLTTKIQNRGIPAGTKLPPERELARLLGVSRTTAMNAYGVLEERELVSTRVGSGTYVTLDHSAGKTQDAVPWEQLFTPPYKSPLSSILRMLIDAPTADETISMAAGMPDPSLYPMETIRRTLAENLQETGAADFGYLPTEGYMPFRNSLAKWQRQKGIQAAGDHVLVVSGSQQGLYLVAKAFVEPRDYVMVESPTYLGAIQVLEAAGARLLSLPNSKKIDLQAMEDYLIRYRPKLFYTIPTFRNPTGQTMTLQERTDLIRLAAKYRLVIVEDDPYGDMWYGQQPPNALKSYDTYGGVIYIGTFSKMLLPGLRTGWVTASPAVINRLAQEKQYVDLHSNTLAQKLLHTCIENDVIRAHLEKVRAEYRKRRDAMAAGLRRWCGGSLSFEAPDGGLYIWCMIKTGASPQELLRQAATAKVTFVPGEAFYPNGAGRKEMRLCFATHNEERLAEGVRRLGKILSSSESYARHDENVAGRPII